MIPVPAAVPVVPGGDQARTWVLDELEKAPYAAARPSLLDRASQAFLDWFTGLFDADRSGAPPVLLAVALGVLVALVVVALLLFGLPRVNRRGAARPGLFGDDDRRTADELRRAAAAALAAGDWSLALLERFRALARGLDERTVVAVFPGTTAAGFARQAAVAFDAERDALAGAASLFDDVRYGGRPAERVEAESVAALDVRLAAARPRLLEPTPA